MSTLADTQHEERVELQLEGMTCATCAARIERKLNKLEGVQATVNFATERAAVRYQPDRVALDYLLAAVEASGYRARERRDNQTNAEPEPGRGDAERLARRLALAIALTLPVALLAMVPPLQFSGWRWVALVLATPVVFWSGLGFHRAAVAEARHGAASMDTLISLGTLAAWGWSTVVLLGGLDADVYFEVAAVITTLILLGRYLEARAKRRSGAAIRALLELGAKEARLLQDGEEVLVPIERLLPGDLFVVRPG